MLCVDDTHRLLSQSLREAGWKVTPWNRFTRRDRSGAAWPSKQKTLFDAATLRLPATKAAAAMSAAAAAARLQPGATLWVYGAAAEGVHTAAAALPPGLFADAEIITRYGAGGGCGGFAVLRATRTAAEATDDMAEWRTRTTLSLPVGSKALGRVEGDGAGSSSSKKRKHVDEDGGGDGGKESEAKSEMDWVVYPGLFAGGGLDVMSAALLRAMPARLQSPRTSSGISVLDFCSGSGTLAAAVRLRSPSAALTLLDADAVALTAARENLGGGGGGGSGAAAPPCTFVLSDGWAGLAAGETFDLIVSNPPVHLGLQPEFTVLSSLVAGCKAGGGGDITSHATRHTPHP